jgi:hypothetical protein
LKQKILAGLLVIMITLSFLPCFVAPQDVYASFTTLTPSKDTYIRSGAILSDTNYGSKDNLIVGGSGTIYSKHRALTSFCLFAGSPIPLNSTIVSAYLQLYYYGGGDVAGRTLLVNRIVRPTWPELAATWNSYAYGLPWSTPGAGHAGLDYSPVNSASAVVPASYGWINWDVTAIVQWAWANTQDAHFRVVDSIEGSYLTYFYSCNYSNASYRPRLVVNYNPPSAPSVVTVGADGIGSSGATCYGNINSTGIGSSSVARRGIKYGLTPADTWDSYETGDFGTGSYSEPLTGLSENTTYWYRAYATNPYGTGYGNWLSLVTTTGAPVVLTVSAWPYGGGSCWYAQLFGNITSIGDCTVTRRGFEYGLNISGPLGVHEDSTYGIGAYNLTTGSLAANETYYYRAYAVNCRGTGYGEWKAFITSDAMPVGPTVTTVSAFPNSTSPWTENLTGSITDIGVCGVVQVGFEYGLNTTSPLTVSNNASYGVEAFSLTTDNITAGQTYYYRAFAVNCGGTGYGDWLAFSTTVICADIGPTNYYSAYGRANSVDYLTAWGTAIGVWDTTTYIAVGNEWSGAQYYVDRGLIESNLASIPTTAYVVNATAILPSTLLWTTEAFWLTVVNGTGVTHDGGGFGDLKTRTASLGSIYIASGYAHTYHDLSIVLDSTGVALVQSMLGGILQLGYRDSNDISAIQPAGRQSALIAKLSSYLQVCYVASPPTVTTQECTSTTCNSTTANGNITSTGGSTVTTRGFCYKTGITGSPTIADSTVNATGSFGTGTYSLNITGLAAGQCYRVRAFAINGAGIAYGNVVDVCTSCGPTITTNAAADVGTSSATLNGDLTSLGGYSWVDCYFQYGLTTGYEYYTVPQHKTGTGTYHAHISALTVNTTYHFRAAGTYDGGVVYGSDMQFTTGNGTIPTTFNLTITSTNGGDVTTPGEGTFTYDAGAVVGLLAVADEGYEFFAWAGDTGTVDDAVNEDTTITMNGDYVIVANFEATEECSLLLGLAATEGGEITVPGEGAFTFPCGSLVTITAEAYSGWWFKEWTGDIESVANPLSFNTTILMVDDYSIMANFVEEEVPPAGAPNVTTLAASDIASSSAWLNGSLDSLGNYTQGYVFFQYGTTTSYGTNTREQLRTATGNFSSWINNLATNTTYHYRAACRYGSYVYGADGNFTTLEGETCADCLWAGIEPYESLMVGDDDLAMVYGANWYGQTFTVATESHSIVDIRLLVYRVGTPSTITVSIRECGTNGLPTGDDLTSGTFDGDSVTNSTGGSWYGTILTETGLAYGETYAICVRAEAGDVDNYLAMRIDTGNGYSGGQAITSGSGGIIWTADTGNDAMFQIYGRALIRVLEAKIFNSYLEDNDALIVLSYLNTYVPYYPDEVASLHFWLQLRSSNGDTVLSQTVCQQWGYMPGSIYLNANQAASLTNGWPYRIYLAGTSSERPVACYILQPDDWLGDALNLLCPWVISTANSMATYYGTPMTTQVQNKEVLNSEGGTLFAAGIPSLIITNPECFQDISYIPDTDTITPGPTDFDTSTTWEIQVGPVVASLANGLGGVLGDISGKYIIAAIFFILYLLICYFVVRAHADPIIATFLCVPILLGVAELRVLDFQLVAALGAVAVIMTVYRFFWSRT